ncbi:MAG: hypothetical protein ACFFER_15375, partial [Candidatus Thorarchaeota archaeon]
HAEVLGKITPIGILKIFVNGLWMIRVWLRFRTKYPRYMRYYDKKSDELPIVWQIKPFLSRVLVRVDPVRMTYWREAKPTSLRV